MHDASMYLYQELLNTNRYRSCQYWKYQRKYFISISEEFITYLSEEKKFDKNQLIEMDLVS